MRKLILISAFVLASASVQAGESRSLVLAANDQPVAAASAQPAEVQPEATKADVKAEAKPEASKPEASKPEASKPEASKPETSKPETSKTHASRPAKKVHVRGYEGDEAKARRIAARYGVYW
jgi:hypothetical protein